VAAGFSQRATSALGCECGLCAWCGSLGEREGERGGGVCACDDDDETQGGRGGEVKWGGRRTARTARRAHPAPLSSSSLTKSPAATADRRWTRPRPGWKQPWRVCVCGKPGGEGSARARARRGDWTNKQKKCKFGHAGPSRFLSLSPPSFSLRAPWRLRPPPPPLLHLHLRACILSPSRHTKGERERERERSRQKRAALICSSPGPG